jgi:hypothetical protein
MSAYIVAMQNEKHAPTPLLSVGSIPEVFMNDAGYNTFK